MRFMVVKYTKPTSTARLGLKYFVDMHPQSLTLTCSAKISPFRMSQESRIVERLPAYETDRSRGYLPAAAF